jgi:hypothetical protein
MGVSMTAGGRADRERGPAVPDVLRRLAAAGGHHLPKRIPPAEHNLKGIVGAAASRDAETPGGPWLIAAVVGITLLLGVLLVVVQRRAPRELEPDI